MAKNEVRKVTNAQLFGRLADMSNGGHGVVILCNRADWIDDVIRAAQRDAFPGMNKPSLWSHCAFVAEPYCGKDTVVMESTVPKLNSLPKAIDAIAKGKLGGVKKTPLSEFYSGKWMPNVALMDFALSGAEAVKITAEGDRMRASKTYYPAAGLIGTWAFYIQWALRKAAGEHVPSNLSNPLTESTVNHLYCSAFVQKAFLRAGTKWDFTHDFAASATSPEHIWRTRVLNETLFVARDR